MLRAGQFGDRIPVGARDFRLLRNVQTGSFSMGTRDFFPGGEAAYHLLPPSTEFKNEWSYISIHIRLYGVERTERSLFGL